MSEYWDHVFAKLLHLHMLLVHSMFHHFFRYVDTLFREFTKYILPWDTIELYCICCVLWSEDIERTDELLEDGLGCMDRS